MKKLLIFTDLDGTLLDHHSYDYRPALPSLQQLQQLACPVILNSSKTLAELQPLANKLHNPHPLIAENGNVIATPNDYFQYSNATLDKPYAITRMGMPYQQICEIVTELKSLLQLKFRSFHEMGVEGVMQTTGLSHEQATLACQRQCSEPVQWLDSQHALNQFKEALYEYRLSITHGGRFIHIMQDINKGDAMHCLLQQYQRHFPQTHWQTVALGDGNNDVPMLQRADIAVLIHNPAAKAPNTSKIPGLIRISEPGPKGWHQAMQQIIHSSLQEACHG